jgi:hypothetical protein
MEFRDYQKKIIIQGVPILKKHKFLYLAMEVRTGKTFTSLGIAEQLRARNVLFLTKKKAIKSIEDDYDQLNPTFNICVINYESIHKAPKVKWDFVILDEAHTLGAFPTPNNRAKKIAKMVWELKCYVILMSGTPTPESFSQMYHQVYGIPNNPFKEYANFYRFSKHYVSVTQKKINSNYINDYSKGHNRIIDAMKPYTINFTQKQAGFKVKTEEHIEYVELEKATYNLIKKLQKNLVVEGKDEVILADTPVKLMSKVHQLCSGTIKFESGNSMTIDTTKAEYIQERFQGKVIAIFYKFKEEYKALKQIMGDNLTDDLEEFNTTNKNIALQIVSGREGISLKKASSIVYYNIDFSATSYWQSRDRMTTNKRLHSDIYWIFSKNGIENKIYKAVTKKKNYTLRHFKKDLLNL